MSQIDQNLHCRGVSFAINFQATLAKLSLHLGKVIVVLCFTLLSACASLETKQQVVIGVERIEYYPYWEIDAEGELRGFARELMDAFSDYAHLDIEYQAYNVHALYEKFFAGDLDLKLPDNPYWQAEKKSGLPIAYSLPVAGFTDGVLVKHTRSGQGLSSFGRLGTVKGFTPFAYFPLIESGKIKLTEVQNFNELYAIMANDEIDGIYFPEVSAKHYLDNLTINNLANVSLTSDDIMFDPSLPYVHSFYYVSTFTRHDILHQFNSFLIDQEAKIKIMRQRYGIESP